MFDPTNDQFYIITFDKGKTFHRSSNSPHVKFSKLLVVLGRFIGYLLAVGLDREAES